MNSEQRKKIKDIVINFVNQQYAEEEKPPFFFLGITGSFAKRKENDASDFDLLLVANSNIKEFWQHIPDVGNFISNLADYIETELRAPVIVSSSLVAQDLMPFVSPNSNKKDVTKNCILHVLLYPTPFHLVRWEAPSVIAGLVNPIKTNEKCIIFGSTKALDEKLKDASCPRDALVNQSIASDIDVCIQAFIVGLVSAYCHKHYQHDPITNYSFHLFRYSGKYLLCLDDRENYAIDNVNIKELIGDPPVYADNPESAKRLIEEWIAQWSTYQKVPAAPQLPSMYHAASCYYGNLLNYLNRNEKELSMSWGIRRRESIVDDRENVALSDLAQTTQGPIYVISEQRMRDNLTVVDNEITQLVGHDTKIWFSLKAFPSSNLVKLLSDFKSHNFAIASQRELNLLKDCSISADSILLHSPSLDQKLLSSIQSGSIRNISISSRTQFEQLQEFKPEKGIIILARLSIPGFKNSKFGMSITELKRVVKNIAGIHIHLGEGLYERTILGDSLKIIIEAIKIVADKVESPIINLGGGLRSVTCEKWLGLDGLNNFRQLIQAIQNECGDVFLRSKFEFEFGRRIIADAVIGLAHVLETKKTEDSYLHFLDFGSGMLPTLKSTVCGVSLLKEHKCNKRHFGQLVGPACYDRDRFENTRIKAAKGDIVAFSNVGAYSIALVSGFGGDFPAIKSMKKDNNGDIIFNDWRLW